MVRRLVGVAVLLWASRALGGFDVEAFDAKVRAELLAESPGAVAAWDEANAARATDPARAEALYGNVIEIAPRFDHAHRRLCGVLLYENKLNQALAACERAFALVASPENRTVLAEVLLSAPSIPPMNVARARELLEKALASGGDKERAVPVLCKACMLQEDRGCLHRCVTDLEALDASSLATAYFATSSAALDERWEVADRELERAHKAGLPDAPYTSMKAVIADHLPSPLIGLAARVFGGWLAVLALLFALGLALSSTTLRLANRGPATLTGGHATGGERVLRRVYGVVLRICGLYFYLSVPLLMIGVAVLASVLLYGIIRIRYLPVKVIAVVGGVALVTLWFLVRGLFVRLRDEDPGPRLDLAAEPKLAECLRRVAELIGAPRVDHVFLTPGTDVAVFERGGILRRLAGKTERCLILGAGVLSGMTVRQLESILAHEHGHLRNADTAGGGFASVVRRSLEQMLVGLARGGAGSWLNPAWAFLRGFHIVFLRVARGAGRLQEILADRWAIVAFGSEAFVSGFEHVVTRSVRFSSQVDAAIRRAVEQKEPLANLYSLEAPADSADIDQRIAAALDRQPGPYDSHPSPRQRIAWAKALAAAGTAPVEPDAEAWSLFADRADVERRMNEVVRGNLAKRGVVLKTEPATPAT